MSEDDSKYKQYFEWARNELKQLTKWKIGIIVLLPHIVDILDS